MMEGFGVHTFRLIDPEGKSKFVKFHWRPTIGTSSVLWDEAVKICGADQDFHRRDLFESIERGGYPEYELGLQIFDQALADSLPYDILDATKLIPEELVPLEMVGKMTLNRNPDNFFAETEQVAFCPSHMVPGIDFSNDPLLQGRLMSYLDTQLSRLGTPNFHQIPINQPKCPFANMQRDGKMQMGVPKGRVNYEPNSLDPMSPRESTARGFSSFPEELTGEKARVRSESFADHYSQARMFYRSVTPQERKHIGMALAFELGKVEIPAIRKRVLGHIKWIDPALETDVAARLGMEGEADKVSPAKPPIDLPASPALRLYERYKPTLKGRSVGVLLGRGYSKEMCVSIASAIESEGASVALIADRVGGVADSAGEKKPADMALPAAPSVLFDAVAVISGPEGDADLANNPDAESYLRDAYRHLKPIILVGAPSLAAQCGVGDQPGIHWLDSPKKIKAAIEEAKKGKVWEREP